MTISFPEPPIIIAHRGCSGNYPENTLPAFSAALESDIHGVELDITLSGDNQYMVIHDDTLERTTNGQGKVCDFTREELQQLDAGSWFSDSFKGTRIPELSEVFELLGNKLLINVEIKPQGTMDHQSLLSGLVAMINDHGLKEQVFLSSFDHQFLHLLRDMDKEISFGLLFAELPIEIETQQVCSLHPQANTLNTQWINTMQSHQLPILPWTVNETPQLRRLVEWGVSGAFSDYPAEVLHLLRTGNIIEPQQETTK